MAGHGACVTVYGRHHSDGADGTHLNIHEYSNALKAEKYADLSIDLEVKRTDIFPIEVGSRGVVGRLSSPRLDCPAEKERRMQKRPFFGSLSNQQIAIDYHPNGVWSRIRARGRVLKIFISDCRFKENLDPGLHILCTRGEKPPRASWPLWATEEDAIDTGRPTRASQSRR